MHTRTTSISSQHIYQVSLVWRIAPLLAALGVIAFLWIVAFLSSLKTVPTMSSAIAPLYPMLLVISVLLLLLGAFLCLFTIGARVITSPEGIFCYRSGNCLYSPWSNLDGLEKISMGAFAIENLRLKRPAIESLSLEEGMKEQVAILTKASAFHASEQALPWLRAFVPLLSAVSLLNGNGYVRYFDSSSNYINPRYIPVGLCGAAWKSGELFQDVRYYAPEAL